MENSVVASRIENLQESICGREQIPYVRRASFFHKDELPPFYVFTERKKSSKNDHPTFGFKTLSEEMAVLQKSMMLTPAPLSTKKPLLLYGAVKNNAENECRFQAYTRLQNEIISTLSQGFDHLLEILGIQLHIDKTLADGEVNQTNLLSNYFQKKVSGKSNAYREGFVKGLQQKEENKDVLSPGEYSVLHSLATLSENMAATKKAFEGLDASWTKLIPNKLLFKTLCEGSGDPLEFSKKFLLHYTISTIEGELICDTRQSGVGAWISTSKMIPGLAHGLKNVRLGEVREILIHPDFAYGIRTSFKKGIGLKVNVQVIDTIKGEAILPPLIPYDTDVDISKEITSAEEIDRRIGFYDGKKLQDYFSTDPWHLSEEDLICFINSETDNHETDEEISHLFWDKYFLVEQPL